MLKKDKTPTLLKVIRWIFPKVEYAFPSVARWFFIKVFFTPLNYQTPEKEKEIAKKADCFIIKIKNNQKIQCYRWGSGPVILLVHGWAGRGTQFRKFVPALNKAGYSAVAFDGPAHGSSEGKSTDIREFQETLFEIRKKAGTVEAIIAHSFGGVASLFAIMNGLQVNTLINIASPTIGDEIINTYLRAINGSWKTGEYFKSYILRTTGRPFSEFTSLYFVQHLQHKLNLLLVHDSEDQEVTIQHAFMLQEHYPHAELFQTVGLGHTRILKDEMVINRCVTFIESKSSGKG